jgi:hypothetical protein
MTYRLHLGNRPIGGRSEGETVQAEALPPDTLATFLSRRLLRIWIWPFTGLPLIGREPSEETCWPGWASEDSPELCNPRYEDG